MFGNFLEFWQLLEFSATFSFLKFFEATFFTFWATLVSFRWTFIQLILKYNNYCLRPLPPMGWFLWCLIRSSAVSRFTFFKMADTYSDSNTSNSDESADEDQKHPIAEAKRLGANLRTPEKAKIARERRQQTNPARKSRSARGQSDPKLSSWQWVQKHKNEHLTSVDSKLRYDACKETISKKKSTVKEHISSLKHGKAKKTI